jgi:hypothetical protein
MITNNADRTKPPPTVDKFFEKFHRDIPTVRVFSMWELELTRLINHFYPEACFEEILALKQIIYLIRDFGCRAVPLWETMIGLEDDIKSSCNAIDDARGVVIHLVNKKILDLVLVRYEYDNKDGRLVHSDVIPSLVLRNVAFTNAAIAIIKDVFDVWTQAKEVLEKNKLSVKTYHVKTVGPGEMDKELAFNGYDCGATYFAGANVPSEAVIMDERHISKKSLPRPKDNDLVAQVINKFYPLLNKEEKCYLNHLARTKHDLAYDEELPIRLLEHERDLFQKLTDVDHVEEQLCNKGILNRDIFRLVDFFNDTFYISPPRKSISFRDDFSTAIRALRDNFREPERNNAEPKN